MALVRVAFAVGVLTMAAGVASAASQPASRIVDRTLLCKTYGAGYPDPLRILTVAAAPRLGTLSQTPYVQVINGPAGKPQGVVVHLVLFGDEPQVILSRLSCSQSSLRIPLSAKGLRGGAPDFGERHRCPVPAAIFIRVRAVFRNPVTFSPAVDAPYLLTAKGKILEGSLAVATKSKTPIAFATASSSSGKARLFVAKPRCQLVD
jgi:hypothetical protein